MLLYCRLPSSRPPARRAKRLRGCDRELLDRGVPRRSSSSGREQSYRASCRLLSTDHQILTSTNLNSEFFALCDHQRLRAENLMAYRLDASVGSIGRHLDKWQLGQAVTIAGDPI